MYALCAVLLSSAVLVNYGFVRPFTVLKGGGVKWQFLLLGRGFESSSWVCCVSCIWVLSVTRSFPVQRKLCQSCSPLWGKSFVRVGKVGLFVVGLGIGVCCLWFGISVCILSGAFLQLCAVYVAISLSVCLPIASVTGKSVSLAFVSCSVSILSHLLFSG